MTDHLSDEELAGYVQHVFTNTRREVMDRHLATCPQCRAGLSDHEALRRQIQQSIRARMRAAHPSSQMTFAALAPRLKRPPKLVWTWRQANQFWSGAAALTVLIALGVILFALLEGIRQPSGSASSAVIPQPPSMAMGAVFTVSIAVTDSGLRLVGYDLSAARPAPGAMFTVTLHWQAQRQTDSDYVAFVHLLDAAGRLVTNDDAGPAQGTRPTSGWIPGERVADPHALALPSEIAPGDYRLAVGLYDSRTGLRFADMVLLDRPITIAP